MRSRNTLEFIGIWEELHNPNFNSNEFVTFKSQAGLNSLNLTPGLVYEAILNAPVVFKVLRSRNPKSGKGERLYVIKGLTFDGVDVYTKGKILKKEAVEVFYVLISSKKSTDI
ncbi:MAG TPA: hypothetical protein VLI39_14765 [Sedimentisphaerales bacterium]|nr:hypothetical protein [Sedimentisphaerales bacterium]